MAFPQATLWLRFLGKQRKKARYRPRLNSYPITGIALIFNAIVYHFFCRNPNGKNFAS